MINQQIVTGRIIIYTGGYLCRDMYPKNRTHINPVEHLYRNASSDGYYYFHNGIRDSLAVWMWKNIIILSKQQQSPGRLPERQLWIPNQCNQINRRRYNTKLLSSMYRTVRLCRCSPYTMRFKRDAVYLPVSTGTNFSNGYSQMRGDVCR